MSNARVNTFREAVFSAMQAKIDAEELGIVSLRKNDYGITIGNQAREDELYPIFVMKFAGIGMNPNMPGYNEGDLSYECSIIIPIDKQSDLIEETAVSAESLLIGTGSTGGLIKQVIDIITGTEICTITSDVKILEGIYSGRFALKAQFTITK